MHNYTIVKRMIIPIGHNNRSRVFGDSKAIMNSHAVWIQGIKNIAI